MFVSVMCYCPEIDTLEMQILFTHARSTTSIHNCVLQKRADKNCKSTPPPHVAIQSRLFQTITLFLLRESVFSKTMMWGL